MLEMASGDPIKEFIESETTAAKNYAKASLAKDVKAAMIKYAGENSMVITNEALMERLQMIGVHEQSNGSRRVLTYTYTGSQKPKAIKLNAELDGVNEA